MILAHRQEVLDAHMNHSNWKEMVNIGLRHPSLLYSIHAAHTCIIPSPIPFETLDKNEHCN